MEVEQKAGEMNLDADWRGRRWWIVGGAALLGMLVLVAVFSLGVYVGRRGWDAGPPSVIGPGRPPQGQDQQPPGGRPQPGDQQPPGGQSQPPWPGERPAVQGRLRSVGPEGIALDTEQGPRFVRVTEETGVFRLVEGAEVEVEAAELRPGRPVAVFGRLERDGRTLTAERIVLLPTPR